uniref:Uncharacterized protein n=1 Tax=Chenopodium quinoa TaxID=63459 RepID=A0A803MZR8_CHEQI
METGSIEVAKVGGKSTVSRCFSKYPLKFIVPNKVGNRNADCVWIYSLSYGGGIVSGDSIKCNFTIGDGCTAVLTTQTSTKILLEKGATSSISECMQDYQVTAMIVVLGYDHFFMLDL